MYKITIRDDDVLVKIAKAEVRFKEFHQRILETPGVHHAPNILVANIQRFPNTIKYIRDEKNAGRMTPELHGYVHVYYDHLDQKTIEEHLEKSCAWMLANLEVEISKFYLPWGAGLTYEPLIEACKKFGIKAMGVTGVSMKARTAVRFAMKNSLKKTITFLERKPILTHWYSCKRDRINLLLYYLQHGIWPNE